MNTFFSRLFGSPSQPDTTTNSRFKNPGPTPSMPTFAPSGQHLQTPMTRAIRRTDIMYNIQAKSLLVSKLPLEIRELIWTYVFSGYFGGKTMHLSFEENDKLRGFLCGNQFIGDCLSRAHGGRGFRDIEHWTGGKMPYAVHYEHANLGWLSAIVACRALYFETTKILYSTTIFDISDCWTQIESLPWLIPFQHLSQINTINITLLDIMVAPNCPNYTAWSTIFESLKSFQGLVRLHIEIATEETCKTATMSNQMLAKVEDRLMSYMSVLESRKGRKCQWELILPNGMREKVSEAEKDLRRKGWKVSRIA